MFSPYSLETEFRVDFVSLSAFVLILFNLLHLTDFYGYSVPFLQPLVSVVLVTIVLGGLFLLALGIVPSLSARWFVYALGTSLMFVMLIGFVLNLVALEVGFGEPISLIPLVLAVNVALAPMMILIRQRSLSADIAISTDSLIGFFRPQLLLFALIPLCTIISVVYLNMTNSVLPLLAIFILLAVIPLTIVFFRASKLYLPLGLFSVGLSILYHKTFWAGFTFGGHFSVISIWEEGLWTLTGESLLSNAILLPALAHLIGEPIDTYIAVVFPLIVASIPVAMYLAYKRYTTSRIAFLAGILFVFAHPFYFQYPSSPRASVPVLFLALLGTVITDDQSSTFQQNTLALLFAVGVIVSHYGTSYYVMAALVLAIALLVVFRVYDGILLRIRNQMVKLSDGGYNTRGKLFASSSSSTLTWSFVAFYVSVTLAWYYFIDNSSKFVTLIDQIIATISSLFVETGGGGSATVVRLQTDYGATSIHYSKYLYLFFGMMIGIGLLRVYIQRFIPQFETRFQDDYLAFSTLLFVLFGVSMLVSGQWGGGRPMMIVFTLCAVYSVIGTVWAAQILKGVFDRFFDYFDSVSTDLVPSATVTAEAAFAILLATFFVLNSGAMAALAYGGEAPSNVPTTDIEDLHWQEDVQMHAWLADQRNPSVEIYGDQESWSQSGDWLNGEIALLSDNSPYRFQKGNNFALINNRSEIQRGYLILTGHNLVDNYVYVNYITTRPLAEYDLKRPSRQLVYTNGGAEVYFTDNTTVELYSNE